MRSIIEIVKESSGSIPNRIRVQAPWSEPATDSQKFKQVYVDTIPEIAWVHIYPLSLQDEMSWQRRIPGESKSGKTLCHEEGNYVYFLLEQPNGKGWDLIGIYNIKEECLYIDTTLSNFESWIGSRFSVTMREKEL